MASVEIRGQVMAFEPDTCGKCGAFFESVTPSNTSQTRPYADVTVTYGCESQDWFTTFAGYREEALATDGVIGVHVGEIPNPRRFDGGDAPINIPVYMRRVFSQKGGCFARENIKLKAHIELADARIADLEAEDKLSKERIRYFLRECGYSQEEQDKTVTI